ncbi:hypothetical protein ESCO_000741 [Escovopsis weberi]|uniref:Uncharacterized protein n=1 Tax=Escovopsis weberi TaxID=150374 RepID=A0A0M9VU16_ESCWE|nr:hypothetical protein ESCO_000741 [Escovopsis weberi]
MAIRDRFRRALRVSGSSDSLSQSDATSSTASSTHRASSSGASPISLIKTVSSNSSLSSFKLSKTFSFRSSRDKTKSKETNVSSTLAKLHEETPIKPRGKGRSPRNVKHLHPSQRPLTEQNLQHQAMLSHFTMTFGATNPAQIEDFDFYGISPCCTRTGSIAGDLS